jgi:ribosomal protein S18 acetylase RimI-like enzyme
MWRDARAEDDDAVAVLFLALNEEDPGPAPVGERQVRLTLTELRRNPIRGKAVVLDIDGHAQGYALLMSFWSNELGGDVCTVDEIFVAREERSRGHATALLQSLNAVWGRPMVAAALEISPTNERAGALYRRLGFQVSNTTMVRRETKTEDS